MRLLSLALAGTLLAFLAVGTAGTTSAGVIDPLPEISGLCREENLWFHCDAAWGGGALLSPRLRVHLAGIELVERLRSHCSDLAVIYLSGYADWAVGAADAVRPGDLRLTKPVRLNDLVEAIEATLSDPIV